MKFRDAPTSVINFVEGTRFTPEKRVRRRSKFEYLLPPRAGGIALALTSMGEMFDAILDVTIFYPCGVVNFWDMMCGDFRRIVVDIRARPVETWLYSGDYENDREYRTRFHRWLTDVWEDKDRRLAALRAGSAAD